MVHHSQSSQSRPQWAIACYLLVGFIILALRLPDLGLFLTHDEAEFWFRRSESLLHALQSGDFEGVDISTHPGVTTMWLGAAGIALRQFLFEQGFLQHETFPIILALHRLPMVLVQSAGIVAGYAMLRRMLPAATATLAALLWAADPFIIGYSRLLHVDALAGTFAILSLLAACLYWNHGARPRWLVLSAACAAMAFLSKSPSLAVLPVIGILALATLRHPHATHTQRLRHTGTTLLIWGGICTLTIVVAWPSVWVEPWKVYNTLWAGVEAEGAQPHMTGNFFLGHDNPSPGVLFYPVALALRTTPLTLLGLALLPWALHAREKIRVLQGYTRAELRDMAALACFVIIFVAAMSLFPKKFNRYLVLAFPAVDILAAAGLGWALHRLWQQRTSALVGVAALVAVINAAWWHPYAIASFNQVLGGAQMGARTFAVGWGEGLEQVADWLNRQPDSTDVLTISHMITSFSPYLREGARATFPDEGELKEGAGYVVVYIYQVQDGNPPPPFDRFYGVRVPLHTVVIHGVEYAWVYEAPPPVTQQVGATFGPHIRLYGFAQRTPVERGETVRFRIVWETTGRPAQDYWLFAHLVGEDGQRHAQVDLPYQTSEWQPGRFVTTELPITIPDDIPPGRYTLLTGLYNPASGDRLRVALDNSTVMAVEQGEKLVLTHLQLPPVTSNEP